MTNESYKFEMMMVWGFINSSLSIKKDKKRPWNDESISKIEMRETGTGSWSLWGRGQVAWWDFVTHKPGCGECLIDLNNLSLYWQHFMRNKTKSFEYCVPLKVLPVGIDVMNEMNGWKKMRVLIFQWCNIL